MKKKVFDVRTFLVAFVLAGAVAFGLVGCGEANSDPDLSGNITISPTGPVAVGTTLYAIYNGSENVTYQWKRGSTSLGTATTQVADQAGNYTVTVSAEGFKSKTSAAVTVTGGGGVPPGPGTGGNPVLANGEIWVDDDSTDQGMLFENGNVYILYYGMPGALTGWSQRERIGTWTSGNTITAAYSSDPDTTFTVSGNKLYEYRASNNAHVATYTKTTGQTISGQSGGSNPYENSYTEANFPALTGAADFIGTWAGGSYTLTLENTGTWAIKMAGNNVLSGRFLVYDNTVLLYRSEGGTYGVNSYGTRTGSTIAMSGGAGSLAASWTKQNGPPANNHAIVAKWYASQEYANAGANFTYEFTADSKLNTGNGIMGMYSWSISGNTITFTVMGYTMGTATFSISGNVLTVTSASNDSPVPNGTYYKPAS